MSMTYKWFLFNFKKQAFEEYEEQKPMRNKVKILDPSFPNSITEFAGGEMFIYNDSRDSDNVYMKVFGSLVKEQVAVHLPTGQIFPISGSANLTRVLLVNIGTGA